MTDDLPPQKYENDYFIPFNRPSVVGGEGKQGIP